ncbi:prolyl oligopeptidase family serine peptidase [Bifidobacterium aquikefiricola]|uniref:Prolyl oligopeptidase family serine peptidase n=1 Tax=Bifidobacterium aquikefiricola TaxID=3059038 RepID=A0AB39U7J8_9BIFI
MSETKHSVIKRGIVNFPRKEARTLRFSLGAPRSARAVGDGSRAIFLRSGGQEDPVTSLWMSSWNSQGKHCETLIADPRQLLQGAAIGEHLGHADDDVPDEEKARRERSRESAEGIVDYSVDDAGERAVFALGGSIWVADLSPAAADEHSLEGTRARRVRVVDSTDIPSTGADARAQSGAVPGERSGLRQSPKLNPTISPDGSLVAYTTGRSLVVIRLAQGEGIESGKGIESGELEAPILAAVDLAESVSEDIKIGLAEFVAGEEMDRYAGFWWSPDSRQLLIEHYDASNEDVWYISDPANPDHPASRRRYPRALTKNAKVGLLLLDIWQPRLSRITWDTAAYEYLASVHWVAGHDALILVQNRRQNRDQILQIPQSGSLSGPTLAEQASSRYLLDNDEISDLHSILTHVVQTHSDECWLDLTPGVPTWSPRGTLIDVRADEKNDTNRLYSDGEAISPVGWQLRSVVAVGDDSILAIASKDPRSFDVVRFSYDGNAEVLNAEPGIWTVSQSGTGMVIAGRGMNTAKSQMTHCFTAHDCTSHTTADKTAAIDNFAAECGFTPNVEFVTMGKHALRAAIVRPSKGSGYEHAEKLPVLVKPYGGPGHQQVMLAQSYYWASQWWADQGFIVLTADGRGTTGRGPAWDRAIMDDMAQVTLDDQIEAVQALPEFAPEADLDRVSIIGWSYGGFLSALAVLRAPEVFHAACAGAPPTDWTLYDTHYTERYLGLDEATYRRNSIIEDAPKLRRPLMLIHGFADDNVSVANSLRLSQALLSAGRAHTVLPLNGITHMTNDEKVAENLLILQRDFLKQSLSLE